MDRVLVWTAALRDTMVLLLPALVAPAAALVVGLLIGGFPGLRTYRAQSVIGVVAIAIVLRTALLAYLLAMTIGVWAALSIARRPANDTVGREARWRLSLAAMLSVTVVFLVAREYGLNSPTVAILGHALPMRLLDMWTMIRLVALFWEVGAGRLGSDARTSGLGLWATSPFTIVGPLLRPSEYLSQRVEPSLVAVRTAEWWHHLAWGLTQLGGGAALVVLLQNLTRYSSHVVATAVSMFLVGPWSFLLTASGTFTFMAAASQLAGVSLPESFIRPFGRPNLSEFWANWNMTVTRFLRDALFYARWGMRRPNPYVNTMALFVLCGAWHGMNAYWLVWGTLHGIAFCVFLRCRKEAIAPWAFRGRLGTALTYLFVCLAWYIPNKIVFAIHPTVIP